MLNFASLSRWVADGKSGLYSQLAFLIGWPIVAICTTPLIGLVLALLLKQTTPRDLWAMGWRRDSPRGLRGAVSHL